MTRKCDKDVTCYGKPEWKVKINGDFLGEFQEIRECVYCNKCYNLVNPEHKRTLVLQMDNEQIQSLLQEMREVSGDPDLSLDPTKNYEETLVFKFRRLHH